MYASHRPSGENCGWVSTNGDSINGTALRPPARGSTHTSLRLIIPPPPMYASDPPSGETLAAYLPRWSSNSTASPAMPCSRVS